MAPKKKRAAWKTQATPSIIIRLLVLGKEARRIDTSGVLDEAMNLRRDQLALAVIHDRDPGRVLHEQSLGLAHDVGALRQVELGRGLLQKVVELGIVVLAVVESLVVALEQEQEVVRVRII